MSLILLIGPFVAGRGLCDRLDSVTFTGINARIMAPFFMLLVSMSSFAAPLPVVPLTLPVPWSFLPHFCQQKLLNSSDTLRGRAWLKQLRATGDDRLKNVLADSSLWPHWRVLLLFDQISWTTNRQAASDYKLGGFTQGALGPIYLSASHDSGSKSLLWIDFLFASELESRSFHRRLKRMVNKTVEAEFFGRTFKPARVFEFDSRTHGVLLLLSELDTFESASPEALERIADFNARLVHRILETNF